MSRKDNCLDNTMAESFFGIMKSELLYAENFESTEAFIKALDNYIEYYNNKSQVKWKESGAIPNSFNNWIMFNQSKFFWGTSLSDTLFLYIIICLCTA